jgi:S1-C subfamily serine protease
MKTHHWRALAVTLGVVVAATVGAGLAFARSSPAPIGTGVVVIETNLGYQNGAAAGTGIVLTRSGEVLTNNHVIRGATTVKVVVPGTGHSYTARVVGYDVSDDVAVLQAGGAANLKTASLTTSTGTIGQAVTALGNAGGTGTLTAASGQITGLGKSIMVSDDQGGTEQLTGLIETDADLQPGDSGGPLLTTTGKVIGMNTAASTGSGSSYYAARVSDGYAIPIGKAVKIAKQIEARTSSPTVHIGATAFLGVAIDSTNGGDLIADVVAGGPADSAGLVPGDTIIAVDGRAVTSPTALTNLVLSKRPGGQVTVAYTDQFGMSRTAAVTLGSGPPQ